MLKLILSTILAMMVSVAAADSSKPATTDHDTRLPVIVKNELVKPGLCRLHFENGATKDVTCENIVSAEAQ